MRIVPPTLRLRCLSGSSNRSKTAASSVLLVAALILVIATSRWQLSNYRHQEAGSHLRDRRLDEDSQEGCLPGYAISLSFGWPEATAIALGLFVGVLAMYEVLQENDHGIYAFNWKSGSRVAFTMALDSYQLMVATATSIESAKDEGSVMGDGATDSIFLAFSVFSTSVAFLGILVGVYLILSDTDFDFDAGWCSEDGIAGLFIMGSPFADGVTTYYSKTIGDKAKRDIKTAKMTNNYFIDKGPKLVLDMIGLVKCGVGSPVIKTFVATAAALIWEEVRMRWLV